MNMKDLIATMTTLSEAAEKTHPYVCVHAKKGKCNVTAATTHEAAKKAAEKWKLKGTAGISVVKADSKVDPASLEEAKKETKTGVIHTADAGGYGRKDDEDDEGKKVKGAAVKRGRGRPKKDADNDGEVKNYDFSAFGAKKGKDVKLKPWDKSKTKKHSLKEWFNKMSEEQQLQEDGEVKEAVRGYTSDGAHDMKRPANQGERNQLAKRLQQNRNKHKANLAYDNGFDDMRGNPKPMPIGAKSADPNFGDHNVMAHDAQKHPSQSTTHREFQRARPDDGKLRSGPPVKEDDQISVKPASQMPKKPGQSSLPTSPTLSGQPSAPMNATTQVIAQGDKTLGTVNNPQLAQQIKQSIGKGEMTLMPDQSGMKVAETEHTDFAPTNQMPIRGDDKFPNKPVVKRMPAMQAGLDGFGTNSRDMDKKEFAGQRAPVSMREGETDKREQNAEWLKNRPMWAVDKQNPELLKNPKRWLAKASNRLAPRNGWLNPTELSNIKHQSEIENSKANRKPDVDIREGDQPTDQMDMGAGLGAGRSKRTLESRINEGKMKELSMDLKDMPEAEFKRKYGEGKAAMRAGLKGDKPTPKATAKKAVNEAAEHRMKAAHLRGKSHALAKQGYNCHYDDMEESRMYHDGYKEGLDECYGQSSVPIQGQVGMTGQVDEMDDGIPMVDGPGGFGPADPQPSHDAFSSLDEELASIERDAAFESLDRQLNSLLTEGEVSEGTTVSMSMGQQGAPDSVSVNATDADAKALMDIVKQAGLGMFASDTGTGSSLNSVNPEGSPDEVGDVSSAGGLGDMSVVDDHDSMLSLIKQMTGATDNTSQEMGSGEEDSGEEQSTDSDDSGEESSDEEVHDTAPVDEEQTEDQMTDEVAEEEAPAASGYGGPSKPEEDAPAAESDSEETEDKVEESLANSEDDAYNADMDFMMRTISGGLNKQKSTGQTTVPVVASQQQRVSENSLADWKKLAGLR